MKNIVLLSIVSIFCLITACSSNKSTTDKDSAESLLQFIPENYSLLDTARGDLNQDGRSDLIMILSKINEQESSDINSNPEKRKLLILLAQEDNSYKEIKSNENVIYCYSCGGMMGDPYQNTTINDNKFVIEFFGGSSWKWARTLTFKYIASESDWYLTEDALVGFHGSDPDNIDTKILTPKDFGEVKFENFDIYNE